MKKLLIICGPTATGKTSLGLLLAKKFNGEIISADSRQIYKGMDIGTGKDLPKKATSHKSQVTIKGKIISFYKIKGINVWGYDLVNPDEEFSVSHYQQIAEKILSNIWKRKKIPIVIGGTGLYLKAITEFIDTIGIPPDKKLRSKLNKLPINKLQQKLKSKDLNKFETMNQSDRSNPRRLIRAIEIAQYKMTFKGSTLKGSEEKPKTVLWIGLTAPKDILNKKIDKRVEERIEKGAENEVRKLIKKGYDFNLPSMSAMGYRQWQSYFTEETSEKEVIKRWKLDEYAYARRQLTWFKKNKRIYWFDVIDPKYQKKVVKLVKQWYSKS